MDKFFKYIRPGFQISRYYLGRYIILAACVLHLSWALLLALNVRAANATPIAVVMAICSHNRAVAVGVFIIVAALSLLFLKLKSDHISGNKPLFLLMMPQHFALWCSAGGGIYAALIQRYADGVIRSFYHIITDQLPMIILALLYTVAMLEARHPPAQQNEQQHV